MKIPFTLVAECRGLERVAGTADIDGVKVEYGDKLRFEYELPDGTTTDLSITQASLDRSADFDVSKLAKGEHVRIVGFVGEGRDGGIYVRPVEVRKGKPAELTAVA